MLLLSARAQTLSPLHSFTGLSDGGRPQAGLVLSGGVLSGTASLGGSADNGTVFSVNGDGTGFTNLHSFTALLNSSTNMDGANPGAGLLLSGGTLYGTASHGGTSGNGAVFKVNTDGTGFQNLHSFTATSIVFANSDGAFPEAGLVLSSETLYGTASYGGPSGNGTVFKVKTDGTGFTTLHSFSATPSAPWTNADGAYPYGGLVLSGNTLYGTASSGGSSGNGTVFRINTDGTGFAKLHGFTATSGTVSTNADGAMPYAGLVLSNNTLYGTAAYGGRSGDGTVFKVNTDASGFAVLHSFTHGSDGAVPYGGLSLSGNILYGTAEYGGLGTPGSGTVFALYTDGGSFVTLYTFTAGSGSYPRITNIDGAYPQAGLVLSGNTLYGTAWSGGGSGNGTVFKLSLAPRLSITSAGGNVIVTWPTNSIGATLESATSLASGTVWTNVPSGPVVVQGRNSVTEPVSAGQRFYRLSQ
jgi:uncharacterized repeat protein (TIGR03803 family)